MKHTLTTIILVTLTICSFVKADEVLWDELLEKNGIYYTESLDAPFDGKVIGSQSGILLKGKKNGVWTGFYDNGKVLWEGKYNQGIILTWKEYHSNGEVFVTGNYKAGKKTGLWNIYNKNGNLIAQEVFKRGKVIHTKIIK